VHLIVRLGCDLAAIILQHEQSNRPRIALQNSSSRLTLVLCPGRNIERLTTKKKQRGTFMKITHAKLPALCRRLGGPVL
jgi:hypothetical protein